MFVFVFVFLISLPSLLHVFELSTYISDELRQQHQRQHQRKEPEGIFGRCFFGHEDQERPGSQSKVIREGRGMEDYGGGGVYSFVACLGHLTIDHASLLRRSTVPSPNGDTSDIGAVIALLSYIT